MSNLLLYILGTEDMPMARENAQLFRSHLGGICFMAIMIKRHPLIAISA